MIQPMDDTCFNPCSAAINPRGNFFSDQYFGAARKTLEELVGQMQHAINKKVQWPPGRVEYLLAELGAWQQSGQSLGSTMGAIRHENVFTTVFRFEPDCLKMLIDVTGFQPFNLKLNVDENKVELRASKEEASSNTPPTGQGGGQNCIGYASKNIVRLYTLPQKLVKERVQCSLSADGILFLCAPWMRC